MRLALLLFVASCAVAEKKNYTGHRLISVRAITKEQVNLLHQIEETFGSELNFWSDPSIVHSTDILVSQTGFGKLKNMLLANGLPFTITNENIQDLLDQEEKARAKIPKNTGCNILDTYCTFDQIIEFLSELSIIYPNRMKLISMGNSYEGRIIPQVVIAANFSSPKDAIWIEAGTHAREWIAVSAALYLIQKLVLGQDSESRDMLSKYDWYINPVHNPDGYVYSHVTDRLWRKNREPCQVIFYGTDLNRNWDADFGGAGTSTLCSSDTYRGRSAFSAPETAALRNAVNKTLRVFGFFSLHCYSQFMLIPYGYTSTKPSRYYELLKVAERMMKFLETVNGTYYVVGTPPDILYPASGGAFDYFYMQGVPYSYTYELRPASGAGTSGFILPIAEIPLAVQEVFVSLHTFATMDLSWPSVLQALSVEPGPIPVNF